VADPAPRRSRWIVAPLAVVVVLALVWTGVWFYAARTADDMAAQWIAREAALGRVYTCASRSVAGYPFRIELTCSDPAVELRGQGPAVTLKARQILAVAQVYQPNLVIAEVTGPLTISETGGAVAFTADWTLLQASVRGVPKAPERISLVVTAAKLARAGEPQAGALARAERLELHIRQQPGGDPAKPGFDIAAETAGALLPSIPALAARPLNAQAAATLTGVSDLRPKPVAVRLREWQAAGGRLQVTNVRVQQGDAIAVARGDLALSARGRLDGTLTLTFAGFEEVVRALGLPDVQIRGGQGGLLAGLSAALGGQTELEGKRAVSIPLRFNDGAVFLGPIPLGQVPPAY
jgi:hypothetical protein